MVDAHELFTIVGEACPARDRVDKAMTWLLSPDAQGMGKKLLQDAHERHGKPVTIEVTEKEYCAYHPNRHRITINTKEHDNVLYQATDDTWYTGSLECTLAHELHHAGEPEHDVKGNWTYNSIKSAVVGILNQNPNFFDSLSGAANIEDARRNIAQFVNTHIGEIRANTRQYLALDPVFQQYVESIERPTIETENKVAALRGEPLRKDYMSARILSEDLSNNLFRNQATEIMLNECISGLPQDQQIALRGYALIIRKPPEKWVNKTTVKVQPKSYIVK